MCMLCDANYFVLLDITILILSAIEERNVEKKIWKEEPDEVLDEKNNKAKLVFKPPDPTSAFELMLNITNELIKKYDSELLWLLKQNLENLKHITKNKIDEEWVSKGIEEIEKLKYNDYEKIELIITLLISILNRFHDKMYGVYSLPYDEYEKSYGRYIG